MKSVYIIHGWDGSPEEPLHQWLKAQLESKGYQVTVPAMPNPEVPVIKDWILKIMETVVPSDNVILVGHSVGCQAILRSVEVLAEGTKIAGIVLIAPWMELDEQTVQEEGEEVREIAQPWMETPIDFKKVKKHTDRVITIFSDNDPYVPVSQKDLFEDKLDAETFVLEGYGHFSPADGVDKLPVVLDVIESIKQS
ncbi:MAG: alpha/beta hydrolase [Candidatus Paceibacterota bacterium]